MNPGQHTFGVTIFFGPDGPGDAGRLREGGTSDLFDGNRQ